MLKKLNSKTTKLLAFFFVYLATSTMLIVFFILPHMPLTLFGYPIKIPDFTLGQSYSFVKVEIGNNDDVYVIFREGHMGYVELKVFSSQDNGYSWNDMSPPISDRGVYFITSMNDNDELSIIYSIESPYRALYSILWSKLKSWSSPKMITNNSGGDDFTHTFIDDNTLMVCYNNIREDKVSFLLSYDFGETWTNYYNFTESHPKKLVASQNQTLYFVTWDLFLEKNVLLKSIDLGQTWSLQSANLPGGGLNLLIHPVNGYLYDAYITNSRIQIAFSEDEGKTWIMWTPEKLSKDYSVDSRGGFDLSIAFSKQGSCFVAHNLRYLPLTPSISSVEGLNYFWIDKDIWTERYLVWFLWFFFPPFSILLSATIFLNWVSKREKIKSLNKYSSFRWIEFGFFLLSILLLIYVVGVVLVHLDSYYAFVFRM